MNRLMCTSDVFEVEFIKWYPVSPKVKKLASFPQVLTKPPLSEVLYRSRLP